MATVAVPSYIEKAQRLYLEQLKNVNILDSSLPLRAFPCRQLWQGTIQKGWVGSRDDRETGGPRQSAPQEAPQATLLVELASPAILPPPLTVNAAHPTSRRCRGDGSTVRVEWKKRLGNPAPRTTSTSRLWGSSSLTGLDMLLKGCTRRRRVMILPPPPKSERGRARETFSAGTPPRPPLCLLFHKGRGQGPSADSGLASVCRHVSLTSN